MTEHRVLDVAALAAGSMKAVKAGDVEVLLIHGVDGIVAVQAKCPHAGAPLEKGALCDGRLVCPWHLGEFSLADGALLAPPPMEPLKRYPVRVDGARIVVGDEPLPPPEAAADPATLERVVALVGTGAAGAIAAGELRRNGYAGKIVAIDPVGDEPVDRTQLSKAVLAGKTPAEKAKIPAFDGFDVERRVATVEKLDAAGTSLTLGDGSSLRFDAAIVATGSRPKRPRFPGAERVLTLRHVADAEAILAKAPDGARAAIVGSSFIGLEAASALVQKGLAVTVVGPEKLPFEQRFGERVARALVALHESKGTSFRNECEVVRADAASVTIRHDDGGEETLPADLLVAGIGVEPLLPPAHDLPLATDGGGIAVDASLRAADGVYVAGDVANVDGTRIEHWRVAQQHALVAARTIAGKPAPADGVPFFWTFHFGKRIGYLGHADGWDEIAYDGDVENFEFLAYLVKGGTVRAVVSCGRDTATAALLGIMRRSPSLDEARAAAAATA